MNVLVERGCGLAVHQKTVVACLLIGRAGETPRKVVKTFSTMTRDGLALRDWLLYWESHRRIDAPAKSGAFRFGILQNP